MTLACSNVKEKEEEGENEIIIERTDRKNWKFGGKMEGGKRNGTSYSSNCASFLHC
jgi:hypothetical protein